MPTATEETAMPTRKFRVELDVDDHGRWNAIMPALPGCGAIGFTPEEALAAVADEARGYIQALQRSRQPVPDDEGASLEDALTIDVEVQTG